MRELIQMKQSELASWKKEQHNLQNQICPILGVKVALDQMVVDHKHRTKSECIGADGAGLVRGVIQFQANVLEGKISNGFKRYGLHKLGVSLPTFLRNLASYLDQGCTNLIHPSEKDKPPKIQRSCYNKLCSKMRSNGVNVPAYPKTGALTKSLQILFTKYNVAVKYYGS